MRTEVFYNWQSKTTLLPLVVDGNVTADVADLMDCESLDIKVVKHRKKRSLDANAYFHVLVRRLTDELSKETPISFSRVKNMMITSYGQPRLLDNGSPVVIKTNIPVDEMMEDEITHCKPCGSRIENDIEVVFYRVYRGSHTYNTAEMARLIDGTVLECKEQGIETMTPDEIRRMCEAWDTRSGRG